MRNPISTRTTLISAGLLGLSFVLFSPGAESSVATVADSANRGSNGEGPLTLEDAHGAWLSDDRDVVPTSLQLGSDSLTIEILNVGSEDREYQILHRLRLGGFSSTGSSVSIDVPSDSSRTHGLSLGALQPTGVPMDALEHLARLDVIVREHGGGDGAYRVQKLPGRLLLFTPSGDVEILSDELAANLYPYGATGAAAARLEAIVAESAQFEDGVFSGATAPVSQPIGFEANDD